MRNIKKPTPGQTSLQVTYDRRFLEQYVGKPILTDPKIALMELIANSWDANARKVDIRLPSESTGQPFSIEDDGTGMTDEQFRTRWMKLGYNRRKSQGSFAETPFGLNDLPKRRAFGKNGKGRHAAFCFTGTEFLLTTGVGTERITYKVFIPPDDSAPFQYAELRREASKASGTKLFSDKPVFLNISAEELRIEIGSRFLSNPHFEVFIDGEKVTFADIPRERIKVCSLNVPDVGLVEVITIDTKERDKDTRLHGIAWQVSGRLVGEASWKNFGDQNFIDGRKTAAKRFSFIVRADCLDKDDKDNLLPDWTGFNQNEPDVESAFAAVNQFIRNFLTEQSAEERAEALQNITNNNARRIRAMGPLNAELWRRFVQRVQEECPRISEKDLDSIGTILARLEASRSKYGLLEKLELWTPENLDSLNTIFESWDIDSAKLVLDELKWRLDLIDNLSEKMLDDKADELHDLQPIFDRGLWIFGPEFESIEYTSNRSMAKVIRDLLKIKSTRGSMNRPDYVILPDGSSSLSFHSRPGYNASHAEQGIASLVIVELKKPSVPLGEQQKGQCWDYVKELLDKGAIEENTKVDCFLLGRTIARREEKPRTEGTNIIIQPVTYDTVLTRAKSRTFKLYEKVRQAPFLDHKTIETYLEEASPVTQVAIFPESDLIDARPPRRGT